MKRIPFLPIILGLSVLAFLFLPLLGESLLPFGVWFGQASESARFLFFNVRLPQALLAFSVGLGLSLAGHVFQTLFRNDLADPYLLGIASSSAFGVVLAVKLSLVFSFLVFSSISLFAFSGGLGSVLFIMLLQARSRRFSNYSVILTGVALNLFFSALILGMYYFSDPGQIFNIQRWLMGSIDVIGFSEPLFMLTLSALVFIFLLLFRQDLNMLLLEDALALARGVNTLKTKVILVILCSLLVAGSVSVAGPLAFIGLIVPHIAKLLMGKDHLKVLPVSALLGGLFLMLCWTLSRIIMAPAVLPVGIVTALTGVPFFIWLISKKK